MDARAWFGALARDAQADALEAEIRAELEAHLELAEEALRAQGRTHDEARSEARARFGDLERTLRACRRERLGGRLMLVRIQWIVIALLACSTVALALYGRDAAVRAHTARDFAMMEAHNARAMLEEARQRESRVPVEHIVVGVGDMLHFQSEYPPANDSTEVQIDGQALFAGIGWLSVAGKTRQEVEALLAARYGENLETPWPVYVIVKSPN